MDNTSSNSFLSNKPDKYNKKDFFFLEKSICSVFILECFKNKLVYH